MIATPDYSTSLSLLPVAPDYFTWQGHRIATYSAGAGSPILLIHSINAAASAFEMRKPFADLSDSFRVHSLDLLGYGNSDRPARRYRATDYVQLIATQLARIGEPTTLIASSLGAAYAVAVADRWPQLVKSLILICPVGISQLAGTPGPVAYAFHNLLYGPAGRLIFRLLTSRAGTRYFLKQQAYHDPAQITPETLDGFYTASRRPGAHYAPICFLTGLLNCNIQAAFARLTQPTLLVWGAYGRTTPPQKAREFIAANTHVQSEVIDNCSMLLQDEQPAAFNQLARYFLTTR